MAKKTKVTEKAAELSQVQSPATDGEPQYLQVQFFDPRTQQYYVLGTPVSRVDEQRLDRSGERGLFVTHTRGRDLIARMSPGTLGWQIIIEPVRGTFDFLVVPYKAKTGIDQVQP